MVSLLIGDTDLEYAKQIISSVVRKNENLRLVDIVTSNKEALTAINQFKPHVFIVNADVIDVNKLSKADFFPKVIGYTEDENKAVLNRYLLKNCNIKLFSKKLNHLISENQFCEAKEKIIKDFNNLKFNFSRAGTKYLIDSIIYSYENNDSNVKLEKNVYPIIAKKYNTDAKHVKWLIIKSINEMYDRNSYEHSLENVADYFYSSTYIKPTAKFIINTVLIKLGG